MALALDGTAQGLGAAGVSSLALSTGLTYSSAGDIIVVLINTENPTAAVTVSSVSSTSGLTFQKRTAVAFSGLPYNNTGTIYTSNEIWWAYASAAHSADVITAHLSGTTDEVTMVAFAVKGFTGGTYSTNPWDGNGALPANHSNSGSTGVTPTCSGVSTTSASGMRIAFWGSGGYNQGSGATYTGYPTGDTAILAVADASGTNGSNTTASFALYSSALSSATVNWTTSEEYSYTAIIDALATAGAAVATRPYARLRQYLRR